MTDDPLINLKNILVNPEMIAKGKSFISDVEYAIYLIAKYREEKVKLLNHDTATKA